MQHHTGTSGLRGLTCNHESHILNIPNECIYHIFSMLPYPQRLKFGLTCSRLRGISLLLPPTDHNPVRAFAECGDSTLQELFEYVPKNIIIGFIDIDPVIIVKSNIKKLLVDYIELVSMRPLYFAAAIIGDEFIVHFVHSICRDYGEQNGIRGHFGDSVCYDYDTKIALKHCFAAAYVAADAGHFIVADLFRRLCGRDYWKILTTDTDSHRRYDSITKGTIKKFSINVTKWLLLNNEIEPDMQLVVTMFDNVRSPDDAEWCLKVAERIEYNVPKPHCGYFNRLIREGNCEMLEWWSKRFDISDIIKDFYTSHRTLPMHKWLNRYLNSMGHSTGTINHSDKLWLPNNHAGILLWNNYDAGMLKLLTDLGKIRTIKFGLIVHTMLNRTAEDRKGVVDVLMNLPPTYSMDFNTIVYTDDPQPHCRCSFVHHVCYRLLAAAAVISDIDLLDYIATAWANRTTTNSGASCTKYRCTNYRCADITFCLVVCNASSIIKLWRRTISREAMVWLCSHYNKPAIIADCLQRNVLLETNRTTYLPLRGETF